MLANSQTENLSFIVHENHYEFVLHTAGRAAVDEWMAKFALIWEIHNTDRKPICSITSTTTKGFVPLHYAFVKGSELANQYRNLPKARTVFLLEANPLVRILDSFLRMLPLDAQYKYLAPNEEAAALDWLLEWFKEKAQ